MLPYKGKNYLLCFMIPDKTTQKRKTLLIASGFDSTLEEEYLICGRVLPLKVSIIF